jgi:hypothetical protein
MTSELCEQHNWYFEPHSDEASLSVCPECFGARQERANIVAELYELLADTLSDVSGDLDHAHGIRMAIEHVKQGGNDERTQADRRLLD